MGISLLILMGAIGVISVLAFSVHWYSMEQLRRSRRMAETQATNFLARTAIAFAIGKISEEIQDPDSPISKTLCSPTLKKWTYIDLDISSLTELASTMRDGKVYSLTIQVTEIEPISPIFSAAKTGFDPVERKITLFFEASCSLSGIKTTLQEKRAVKIIHIMPSILGKFSFYVKNVGSNPDIYNRFASDINGFPDDRACAPKAAPLVFKNGGNLDEGSSENDDPEKYKTRGYIYLGGGKLILNLTNGNGEQYGENFHFFPLKSSYMIPGYYHENPPTFFSPSFDDGEAKRIPQTLNPPDVFSSEFAYCIKHTISGFFTTDDFEQNLNQDGKLAVSFPGPERTCDERMFSSILHLYGGRTCPSPTLVLGDVQRRYADLSAILVEATGNSVRDAVATFLPQISDATPLSALSVPSKVPAMKKGDLPEKTPIRLNPTGLAFALTFPNRDDYRLAMCKIITEPYLRSFDYLFFKEEGDFRPKKTLFGTDEALEQTTFSVSFHPSVNNGMEYYKDGNPDEIPDTFLQEKVAYRVPGMEQFKARFIDTRGRLNINATVLIEGKAGKTYILNDRELIVLKGGIVVLQDGDLEISALKIGGDPDECLTLCALNGNIVTDLSKGKIEARLIALRGKIINKTPTFALDLDGGIAVRDFPSDTFREGGRICFDSRGDPTNSEWNNYYRIFISDVPSLVKESH